jgi:hypothetical protein
MRTTVQSYNLLQSCFLAETCRSCVKVWASIIEIEFKPIQEENGRIIHLALTVNRHTDHFTVEKYRKPTSIDTTIHYTSNHPMEHKMAACRYLVNRTFTLPITQINKEQALNNVLIITRNNGFQTQLIQRLHDTMTHKGQKEHNNKQTWVTFTYQIPLARKVTNLFKHIHLSILTYSMEQSPFCEANQ